MCRLNIDGKELNDKLFYSLVRKHYTDKEKTGRRPGEQEEEKMELTGLGLRKKDDTGGTGSKAGRNGAGGF